MNENFLKRIDDEIENANNVLKIVNDNPNDKAFQFMVSQVR